MGTKQFKMDLNEKSFKLDLNITFGKKETLELKIEEFCFVMEVLFGKRYNYYY